MRETLLIVGASARAAAYSALRAGLRPWCVDLFADADLQRMCPARRLEGRYPWEFLDVIDQAPPGPWMYTGGLENYPDLIEKMAQRRPLWGNGAVTLRKVRDPLFVQRVLEEAGLPSPRVQLEPPSDCTRRWLVKPLRGAGGTGITWLDKGGKAAPGRYFQEYLEGEPAAALFAGDGHTARLLGLSWQLVGETWLHARAFQYCGSIHQRAEGLVPAVRTAGTSPAARQTTDLEALGHALTAACQLRGLFGVDAVLRPDGLWPVEVNPRYTASIEVLERATSLRALGWHRAACLGGLATLTAPADPIRVFGKAHLFARRTIVFPPTGPWQITPAAFADLPHPDDVIEAGRPILTFFAEGSSMDDCFLRLQECARELDSLLGN